MKFCSRPMEVIKFTCALFSQRTGPYLGNVNGLNERSKFLYHHKQFVMFWPQKEAALRKYDEAVNKSLNRFYGNQPDITRCIGIISLI